MDQLTYLIDATFSDVEKFESSSRHRYTLKSLYTALGRQLQDGLMPLIGCDIVPRAIRLEASDRSGTIVVVTS